MIFTGLADDMNCYGTIQSTEETGYVYFGMPFLQVLFLVNDYGRHNLALLLELIPKCM
jgi:hypothetical protein